MTGAVNMKKMIDKTTVARIVIARMKLPLYFPSFFVIACIFAYLTISVNFLSDS